MHLQEGADPHGGGIPPGRGALPVVGGELQRCSHASSVVNRLSLPLQPPYMKR